ncbi:unnamed protein product [Echinostoma caproni]|uniref:Endo/exonuclease/phosphatase domain-containing protein n=1 Tax=Echinostoma caproni TaxID=27848 RepID=A0A183BD73_9TREM|nr:unnamed protein product [Echinostoma caproni]
MCVYRAPQATETEHQELIAQLRLLLATSRRVLLVGDFNMPEINWSKDRAPADIGGGLLVEWLQQHALSQHMRQATHFRSNDRPTILDLVITRTPGGITMIIQEEPPGESDHVVLRLTLESRYQTSGQTWRRYGKVSQEELARAAQDKNWVPHPADASLETR